jgi:hypothetical protein
MTRGDAPDARVVMRPKFGDVWVVFGVPRLIQFSALNASMRTCTFALPPAANVLCNPRSTFFVPGPRNVLRPELPKVPSAFGE